MNRRVTLTVVGALLLLAAVAVQLYRFTLDPMPVWAGPTAWLLTLACLPGGAWLLATARTPRCPTPPPMAWTRSRRPSKSHR